MAYTRLTAAEAAAMIKDQDNIGLSGFTPNGVPKATFRELSKRAIAEHEAGANGEGIFPIHSIFRLLYFLLTLV